jgi:hypothetical protein
MIASLKFRLPDEKPDYLHAQRGPKYLSALYEVWGHVRHQLKYAALSETEAKVYGDIRERMLELLQAEGIYDLEAELDGNV